MQNEKTLDLDKMARKQWVTDILKIILGTFLLALSLSIFFEPYDVVTGGVTGIGIIIKELSFRVSGYAVPLYLSNLIINIPLVVIGLILKGKKFMGKTLLGTLLLSLFLYVTAQIRFPNEDMILNALFGGILCGAGVGLVLSASATTGGTDLLATIVQHFYKRLSIAWLLFFIDAVIILCGSFVFGLQKAMYAVIGVYLTSKIADQVVEGFHYSKAVYIISKKWDAIAEEVMEKMERGVTSLQGKGMFSGQEQQVLFCVISSKELVKMKNIIYRIDPQAFVVVSDAREVLGEGFLPYDK